MKPKISTPTIPLPEAQARVARFRAQYAEAIPQANVPRAILIPIYDILAIINKYETIDSQGNIINELQGVRAYFAVKETDEDLPDDVTALIVPVDLKGNDVITVGGDELNEEDGTEIYDFTKPCPDQCDPDSPLYIE